MKNGDTRALRAALEASQGETKALRQALKRLEAERAGWEGRLASQGETIATLRGQLADTSRERQVLRDELKVAQEQIERAQARVNLLSKAVRAPGAPAPSRRRSSSELREANQDAAKARSARVAARADRARSGDDDDLVAVMAAMTTTAS